MSSRRGNILSENLFGATSNSRVGWNENLKGLLLNTRICYVLEAVTVNEQPKTLGVGCRVQD